MTPEHRRMIRSIVQVIVALGLLGLAWYIAPRLQGEALLSVAQAALAIVGIGTLFYGLENTTRAFKLSVSAKGVEVDAGEEGGQ